MYENSKYARYSLNNTDYGRLMKSVDIFQIRLCTLITTFYFIFQYSLDNEAERQKYELQAERIRQEMNIRLGHNPNQG